MDIYKEAMIYYRVTIGKYIYIPKKTYILSSIIVMDMPVPANTVCASKFKKFLTKSGSNRIWLVCKFTKKLLYITVE